MATNIGKLSADITLNATSFMASSKAVAAEATSLASKVGGVLTAVALPVSALGAFEWLKQGLKDVKDMDNEARKMGVEINELGGLMRLAGGDSEGFVRAVGHLRKSLGEVQVEGKDVGSAFHAIGLSLNDLKGVDTVSLFGKVADKLNNLSNSFDAAYFASKIFGEKGYKSALYAIEQGSAGIDEAIKKNKELAGVFTSQDVANTRAALRSLKDVDESITAIQRHLAVTAAPFLKTLADGFQSMIPDSDAFQKNLTAMMRVAAGFAAGILRAVKDVRNAFRELDSDFGDVIMLLKYSKYLTSLGPGQIMKDTGLIQDISRSSGTWSKIDEAIEAFDKMEKFGEFPMAAIRGGSRGGFGESDIAAIEAKNALVKKLEEERLQLTMTADEWERYKIRVLAGSAETSKAMQAMMNEIRDAQENLAARKLKQDLVSPLDKFRKEFNRIGMLKDMGLIGDQARGGGILKALEALESANALQSGRSPEIAIAGSKEAFNAIRDSAETSKDPLQRIAEATAAAKVKADQMTDYLREIAKAPLYLRKSDLSKGD